MPKETFINLPEEKKERIMKAAVEEFYQYSYDKSSINRIVLAAGISKGSFYQYFEDKKDLYKYMFTRIGQEKVKYLSPAIQNPFQHSFFQVMREMFASGLAFANENPVYSQIGIRLLQDKQHMIYKEVIGVNEAVAIDIYKQLLLHGIKSGELRQDIDTDFVARLLYNMSAYITIEDLGDSLEDVGNQLLDNLDKLMDLMANGIQKGAAND